MGDTKSHDGGQTAPQDSENALRNAAPDSYEASEDVENPTGGEVVSPPGYTSEDELLAMVDRLVNQTAEDSVKALEDGDEPAVIIEGDDEAEAADFSRTGQPGRTAAPGRLDELLPDNFSDEDFRRLRELILGREIAALENLHHYISDPESRARSVSQVITEAILLRNKKDNRLDTVLKPTVDHIVRNSVRQNPSELANSLFPVIGPAIRRSIAESIKGMFQDFSRALEMGFSLKGLKWRLEALRTGRSFSEVVLLNTLEYQVEQLFLVKTDTGELLDHLVAEGALAKDGEQVAAMFTAVQQFVNDSFAQGGLNTLEFGDVNVFVVNSSLAYIACVVRGQVPSHLRVDIQKSLELVVMEYADEIENFKGDSSVFLSSRRHVEGLMTTKYKSDSHTPLWAKIVPYLLLAVVLGGVGVFLYKDSEMKRLERLIYTDAAGSGFVPVRVETSLFNNWEVVYLRDDLADSPEASLEELGIDMNRLRLVILPYVSQDPEIVERRVEKFLDGRPEGLNIDYHDDSNTLTLSGQASLVWLLSAYERLIALPGIDTLVVTGIKDPVQDVTAAIDKSGTLHLEGEASGEWISLIREKSLATSGIIDVDTSRLRDPEAELLAAKRAAAEAEVNALIDRINTTVILYPVNKDVPVAEDLAKLDAAVDDLVALEKLASELKMSIGLTIYGHADATGSARRNYELSQERTKTLAAMLYARGSRIPITNYGMGSDFASKADGEEPAAGGDQSSRKIELQVHLTPLTAIEK
ncbi:hypothetical protein C4J81_01665 [Deltaproteobacteria bacterium Smac51]|nr:hypothetical protein C4J81_01665 [Deltaproteobacteria bacterium Smac51]